MKEGSRSGYGRDRSRLRNVLVVTEVAVSALLLIGAGLLVRSFWQLQRIDPGFRPDNVLTMRIYPSASGYPSTQKAMDFYDRLMERLQTVPGVTDAAVAGDINLVGQDGVTVVQTEGHPFDLSRENIVSFRVVSPSYFHAMGIRLLHGRLIEAGDQPQSQNVAVINESFARTHWPNEDPIGRRIRLLDAPPEQAQTAFLTVVGVIDDAKNDSLTEPTRQEVCVSMHQRNAAVANMGFIRSMTLLVHSSLDPLSLVNTVREQVWALDSTIPLTDIKTMSQIIDNATVQQRFDTVLLGIFAFIGLALAAIGIYGVMSFSVTQRTNEIGIRMALGAKPQGVLKLVISQGMILALIGLAIGLAGAFALTRLMGDLLYHVTTTDPVTFVAFPVILAVVALAACFIPALRASRVDPMIALRYE